MASRSSRTLAVVIRNQWAAAAVVRAGEVLAVARFSLRYGGHQRVAVEVGQFAVDYAVTRVITDREIARMASTLQPVVLTPAEAKQALLGESRAPHAVLYDRIISENPKLARFVNVIPGRHRVAQSDWRRTAVLLSVALARAAELRVGP